MPIVKPKKNEPQATYISRCIKSLAKTDPKMPNKQRVAICYSTWRESKKKQSEDIGDAEITIKILDGETVLYEETFKTKDLIESLQNDYGDKDMAKLTYKQRKKLPKTAFCDPEKRRYPAHDAAHVRNGIARIRQHPKDPKYGSILRCLMRRAKKFKIKVSEGVKKSVQRKSEDPVDWIIFEDTDFALVKDDERFLQWARSDVLSPELLLDSLKTADYMDELSDEEWKTAKTLLLDKAEAYIKATLGEK